MATKCPIVIHKLRNIGKLFQQAHPAQSSYHFVREDLWELKAPYSVTMGNNRIPEKIP